MSKVGADADRLTRYSFGVLATGTNVPGISAAAATKPAEQAPHALGLQLVDVRSFEDPCSALSAVRQSTGQRPASRITNKAMNSVPRWRVKADNLFAQSYLRVLPHLTHRRR